MELVERAKYRVTLHSKPAPGLTYYEGHVDVWAVDRDDAEREAKRTLRRTSFPERSASCWTVDSVVEL